MQEKSEGNRKLYAKQGNFCVSLLRKIEKRYYGNLNEKSVIGNKLFRKALNPMLSDNIVGKNKFIWLGILNLLSKWI